MHRFGDDFRLVGIGVSQEGRVFATAPAGNVRSRYSMVEVDQQTGSLIPYPNAEWNKFTADPQGQPEWVSVQALWVDRDNHLWALDSSLPKVDQGKLPPKLVEFDLATNKPIRQYTFPDVVTPKDSLNDVRIDTVHNTAYLTNCKNGGGLLVVDLTTGHARMVLVKDHSTAADPSQHLMIGDQVARDPDGNATVTEADGIALSADSNWLYYRPLTDHNYWRVPTAALRDATLAPAALAAQVQFLGTAALTGGLITDQYGTLYGGDLENSTVVAMKPMLITHTMISRIFLRDPGQLAWADGFAISQGYLYISDSHLNEVAFQNNKPRSGPLTIFRVPLPKGS